MRHLHCVFLGAAHTDRRIGPVSIYVGISHTRCIGPLVGIGRIICQPDGNRHIRAGRNII